MIVRAPIRYILADVQFLSVSGGREVRKKV